MKRTWNVLKSISYLVIGLLVISFIVWTGYVKISGFFKSFQKNESFLSCVEFKTDNNKMESLVYEINSLKMENIKSLNLECDHVSVINIDGDLNHPPEAADVWGIYHELTNFQIIKKSFPVFLEEYYIGLIGASNCEKILIEVNSWLEDPRMDSYYRTEIKKALEE